MAATLFVVEDGGRPKIGGRFKMGNCQGKGFEDEDDAVMAFLLAQVKNGLSQK